MWKIKPIGINKKDSVVPDGEDDCVVVETSGKVDGKGDVNQKKKLKQKKNVNKKKNLTQARLPFQVLSPKSDDLVVKGNDDEPIKKRKLVEDCNVESSKKFCKRDIKENVGKSMSNEEVVLVEDSIDLIEKFGAEKKEVIDSCEKTNGVCDQNKKNENSKKRTLSSVELSDSETDVSEKKKSKLSSNSGGGKLKNSTKTCNRKSSKRKTCCKQKMCNRNDGGIKKFVETVTDSKRSKVVKSSGGSKEKTVSKCDDVKILKSDEKVNGNENIDSVCTEVSVKKLNCDTFEGNIVCSIELSDDDELPTKDKYGEKMSNKEIDKKSNNDVGDTSFNVTPELNSHFNEKSSNVSINSTAGEDGEKHSPILAVKVNRLVPKQIFRKRESEKKRESMKKEKERLRKEKQEKIDKLKEEKIKKQQEKVEMKKREKEEKEEMKKREKEEKEEIKKREKEEKEKKKQVDLELKNEEKRAKEEEKKLKEEERKKKEEAKEEEKRKRDGAKEEERRKKEAEKKKEERAASAFASFFTPKRTECKSAMSTPVEDDSPDNTTQYVQKKFMPFEVKADMKLATVTRRMLETSHLEILDAALLNQNIDVNNLYIELIKLKKHLPISEGKTWPLSDDTDDDVIIIEAEISEVESSHEEEKKKFEKKKSRRPRAKLLQFHENRRPPYWGTWRKKSSVIRPRNPFSQENGMFEYDIDSDDEWEEEEPGESLHGSDDEKESEDEYEVDNKVFVPHGYLSDEEGQDEFEDLSPEAQKAKLKFLEMEFEAEMKEKTEKLKPRLIGCVWFNNTIEDHESVGSHIAELLISRRAIVWNDIAVPIEIGTFDSLSSSPVNTPAKNDQNRANKSTTFPESAIPSLIKLIHGTRFKHDRLVDAFCKHMLEESNLASEVPSKKIVSNKKREISEWMVYPNENEISHPMMGRCCWYVNREIREKYGLLNSSIDDKDEWMFNLQTPRKSLNTSTTLSSTVAEQTPPVTPITPITKYTKVLSHEERQKQLTQSKPQKNFFFK